MSYQEAKSTRVDARTIVHKFRGGELVPVMGHIFRESESGTIQQNLMMKLAPVAGEMLTPIEARVAVVMVPAQAIDEILNPLEDYVGSAEVTRTKLLSGTALFGLEAEGIISKRMGIVPISIAGVKSVSVAARLSHNVAVNFLRKRKFIDAVQLLAANVDITPALIGETVLKRLNGVLDPEDRVNGAVALDFGSVQLPLSPATIDVDYIAKGGTDTADSNFAGTQPPTGTIRAVVASTSQNPSVDLSSTYADMSAVGSNGISLSDFYDAQRMDQLTRIMSAMLEANPVGGHDQILSWAAGLSIPTNKNPYVLYEKSTVFAMQQRVATDGADLDVSTTDLRAQVSLSVPVAPSEFGGVALTFVSVHPDEVLASQPHPFWTEPWSKIPYIEDELALIDPVPVTIRELNGDCDLADEGTIALYVGKNTLKESYVSYGFARNLDTTKVANKTAVWQLEIPMSVTPQSVLYPAIAGGGIDHYPFKDGETEEIVTCTISSRQAVRTPLQFGATPIEEMPSIETGDVFGDA